MLAATCAPTGFSLIILGEECASPTRFSPSAGTPRFWLRISSKNIKAHLTHTYLAQISSKQKNPYLAHSDLVQTVQIPRKDLAQIPSKKEREHLAQKDIKQPSLRCAS